MPIARAPGRAFVPVDCASLPEQLLESELFGARERRVHRGRPTKPGLIEVAHRGTLFLDEIAELPSTLQVKLLRALQERPDPARGQHVAGRRGRALRVGHESRPPRRHREGTVPRGTRTIA